MEKSASGGPIATPTPTPTQNAAAFSFSSLWGGNSSGNSSSFSNNTNNLNFSKPRPGTSSGPVTASDFESGQEQSQSSLYRPPVLTKDRNRLPRKASFGSFTSAFTSSSSPARQASGISGGGRRRANSSSSATNGSDSAFAFGGRPGISVVTDNSVPPALPDFALAAKISLSTDVFSPSSSSTDSYSKMLNRTTTMPANGFPSATMMPPPPSAGFQSESSMVHQHIQEMANKRISTLDYLRKAHEGRVYWFNTLLFDKPDLSRMPYFDSRRLARRATNYLLLGLSLPTVVDLNSSTAIEFLRSLNLLLSEFDSFQQLHSENGGTASSLSRARIPQMFRRATPSAKSRRSSSAQANDLGYADTMDGTSGSVGGSGSIASSSGMGMGGLGSSASVINFGQSESDLLPGEEYTHLLTPSLPFDPDFFETFATLCDVLIDCYTRMLSLIPTPRECTGPVAELFTKADARVRKIIIQGIVKEFEDSSRSGIKTEVANVGKVVLGGLM